MSKELETKCPSGDTLLLTGNVVDNPKLLQAVEEYKNTFHGEDFDEFDLFEKQPKMKKQYSSKQRKIHKLKRENVVLGQQRSQLRKDVLKMLSCSLNCNSHTINILFDSVANVSEKIGKNSNKIQRLRTQIQQEKKLNEYSNCT